jgi:hypothetical protein
LLNGINVPTVDKIVDMHFPKFHRVQQPRPSKLLNLKMRLRVAHLCPRQVRYQAALRPDICCFLDFKPLSQFPIPAGLPKSTETPGFAPYYSAGLNSTSIEIEDPKQIH